MPYAQYGEFCQWYPSSFSISKDEIAALIENPVAYPGDNEDGRHGDKNNNKNGDTSTQCVTFNCAEQFMMFCKAGRFRDATTQRRIMATADPKQQKRLGQETAGFYADYWDPIKSQVVVAGNKAKFGQNRKLGHKLLATGDRLLVEAALHDRVWGIGYTAKHAMQFRQHWGARTGWGMP